MKAYNKREFTNILNDNGYEYIRCKGSHFIYQKKNEIISVPKNLNKIETSVICNDLFPMLNYSCRNEQDHQKTPEE